MTAVASGVPNQDSVSGTTERMTLASHASTTHVNATSGPRGEDAQGKFWNTVDRGAGEVTSSGDVTCLSVDGNRAAVRGTIDESTDPLLAVGSEVQIQLTDNGSPGVGADSSILLTGFGPQEGCPAFFDLSEVTIIDGNFTVKDS